MGGVCLCARAPAPLRACAPLQLVRLHGGRGGEQRSGGGGAVDL